MNRPAIRNALLAAPAVLAVAAPTAEASTALNQTATRQVQTLARSILNLHEGKPIINLSRDSRGRPVASYELNVKTSSAGQGSATGDYRFRLITGTKAGQLQPQDPRLLQIVAQGQSVGGVEELVEVKYSLDPRTNSWGVQAVDEYQGPSTSPSAGIGTSGAYWAENIHVAVHPDSPDVLQAKPQILKDIFKLALMTTQAAAYKEPISQFPPYQVPLG
jgi:hypothetical protein